MNTLRLGSGRQLRSAALVEMPLPLVYDADLLPGARILGTDGQIYESMRDPVSGLYEWKVRAQGERGPAVQLQKSNTHLQWRVEGSTGAWIDLVPLEDLLGPAGEQGDQGPSGPGFAFQGSVATVGDLPTPSTQGHAFLVSATSPSNLYIYNGTAWVNSGPIQGPPGEQGEPGSEVQLQKTATEIQWRLVGAASWTTLVLLADLKGDAGTSVELRKTSTEIQWRLVGAASWTTLVLLDDIKGPVGDTGDQGLQGPPGNSFSYQGTVATVAALPNPSTQGFAFRVVASGDLHIYNGTAWVNAGPLQGPKGDQGDQGLQGPAGPVAGTSGQAVWNNGGAAAGAAGLTFDSSGNILRALFAGATFQARQTITASNGVYTVDATAGNEFVTAAAINGATTINLSNLANIPSGAVWRCVLSFSYTSGTISWFSGNSGYTVKWDGGSAMTPTASEVETVVITVVGGSSTIQIATLRGVA